MVAKCLVKISNNTNMNVSRDLLPCLQYLLMGREYCSELALKLPLWKLLRREPGSVAEKIRFDGGMCRARTYNRPVMSGELYH